MHGAEAAADRCQEHHRTPRVGRGGLRAPRPARPGYRGARPTADLRHTARRTAGADPVSVRGWSRQRAHRRLPEAIRLTTSPIASKDVLSQDMAEWWSIEVLHGEFSASQWESAYSSDLIEAALTNGALDATWHTDTWGVAFEVQFEDAGQWQAFRSLPVVRAALDAVPDPVNGLLIYRGRGGTSASGKPRRPKPAPSAAAVSLPEPQDEALVDVTSTTPPELVETGAVTSRIRYRPA